MNLHETRYELVNLEQSILFALIERSQKGYNSKLYNNFNNYISKIEILNEDFGVFKENRKSLFTLVSDEISENINKKILNGYLDYILPLIKNVDAEAEPPFFTKDYEIIYLISKRVNLGFDVAENKYFTDKSEFDKHIKSGDRKKIMEMITDAEVEQKVLDRVAAKSESYLLHGNVSVERNSEIKSAMIKIYKEIIIPYTKEVEVQYLLGLMKNI